MTVADKIAQRTAALTAIKAASKAAVAAKGGTPADNLSGIPAAIASIPTGGELPELTMPAEVGHVVTGKEYIDAAGNKQTGTLVVCDSIAEVETIGVPGVGLSVCIESPVDGSSGELTLPEPNLLAENIKNGVSIFGVPGTAKTLRVETGTITPAEDITAIRIACTAGFNLFVLKLAGGSADGKMHWTDMYCTPGISATSQGSRNTNAHYVDASGKAYGGILNIDIDDAGGLSFDVSTIYVPAGCTYAWATYYWEDT